MAGSHSQRGETRSVPWSACPHGVYQITSQTTEMRSQRTELYRHFNADGRLLYVGISVSSILRYMCHRLTSVWLNDVRSMTIEPFPDKGSAKIAELNAIRNEFPVYNVQQSKKKRKFVPASYWRLSDKEKEKERASWKKIGNRIMKLRVRNGFSRHRMASELGVTYGNMADLEKGNLFWSYELQSLAAKVLRQLEKFPTE